MEGGVGLDSQEDETRLEEQLTKELDDLREKLASGAVKGTPVTPESFAAHARRHPRRPPPFVMRQWLDGRAAKWKVQKRKEKEAAERKAKAKVCGALPLHRRG
jgi:hypothetical protein